MDEAQRKQRRRLLRGGVTMAPLVSLLGVLALLAAGIAPGRLRPVAAFLGLASVAVVMFETTRRLEQRYLRRLGASGVPLGVRLDKPFWTAIPGMILPVGLGALLGAILAMVNWPGIGVGVLLTFTALAAIFPYFDRQLSPRGLTFEPAGLRVHASRLTFLVPWTSIRGIECVGPDHSCIVTLRLVDPGDIIASSSPPDARARVEAFIGGATNPTGKITLWPGTAGLDGQTLARAIAAARGGRPGQVN